MRQRGCHFAHGGQTGDVHQLGLQLLQPGFGLLAFRKVADETCKVSLIGGFHLADRQFHRKRRAVRAFADDHPADADDAPLSGLQIPLEIAVMAFAVGRRHHDPDVLADDLFGAVAEKPFRGGAE